MAEVIRYVDPNATGAANGTSWTDAYTSLSAWEAAQQTDLVTAGNWHHVYCRSSGGTADGTAFTINGWTTDADHYILIEAASTDRAEKGGINTSKYRLSTGASVPVGVYEDYVRIDGIQFVVSTASNIVGCNYGATSDVRVTNCYAQVTGEGNTCLAFNTGALPFTISNTVVHGSDRGLYSSNGTVNAYNCVFRGDNTNYGIRRDTAGTMTVVNCAVFNQSDDFVGTITVTNCASDDGDGANAVAPSGADWANEFTNPVTGDYTLLSTGNLYDAGVGPGTDANVPATDIDGDTRSGATCDIGVDEYVAAGGGISIPVVMAQHGQFSGGMAQ